MASNTPHAVRVQYQLDIARLIELVRAYERQAIRVNLGVSSHEELNRGYEIASQIGDVMKKLDLPVTLGLDAAGLDMETVLRLLGE